LFGASTGVADVKSRLTKENTECPNQKYVLVGYSQGGMVISSSLSGIPAAIVPKIVAVVLYGAGDGSSVSAKFKSKTLANCAPGDFVS
jgi:cutinase